jgi:Tfp pilus assembly protein PilF
MKLLLHVIVSVVSLFGLNAFAQIELSPASVPGSASPKSSDTNTTWLTGKIVLDAGSVPPDRVTVILRCGMSERARATSDSKGNFSMRLNTGGDEIWGRTQLAPVAANLQDCEVVADSPEYASQSTRLFGGLRQDINDVGTIVVHPRTAADASTVSATTLAAPERAKSAFVKGQQQEKKGRWAAACDNFRKAIQAYPRYALAWLELGRAQVKQNNLTEAQQAFRQAATQDSRLFAAYAESAKLALKQQQWKELAADTERLLQLSPDASADAWFLNSAANFNLGDTQRAESSASRGLNLDPHHQVPQLEYLYAMILARRGAYAPAVEHLQKYLRLSPKAEDASTASARLQELQKLVDSSSTAQR